MEQYIGSQEHFEDEVNAYHDAKEQMYKDQEQKDDRQQIFEEMKTEINEEADIIKFLTGPVGTIDAGKLGLKGYLK